MFLRRFSHALWPWLAICGSFSESASAQVPIRTIARSVQQAPGAPVSTNYGTLAQGPVINDAGQIVFESSLGGTGVSSSNNTAVFSNYSGTTNLVVREGTPAPGDEPGALFGDMNLWRAVGNGQVVVQTQLTNSAHGKGIYSGASGALQPIARTGDAAPGAGAGATYGNFGGQYVNQSGSISFSANVGGLGPSGIWTNRSGPVQLVALSETAAPGFPIGSTWGSFSEPVINGAGIIAFNAGISGNLRAVYKSSPQSGFSIVAKTNDSVPGLPSGSRFNSFGPVSINSSGKTAFKGDILGGPGGSAIYSEGSGTVGVVAQSGTPAPGTPSGVRFSEFINSQSPQSDPIISANGDVAFAAFLSGTGVSVNNDGGIWTGHAGALRLLAREDSQPPGMAAGARYIDFGNRPTMNAAGQIAFTARVSTPATAGYGVFATDHSGNLLAVAYPGMQIEVSPGIFGTVLNAFGSLDWMTNENGGPSSFNSSGQLVFWAEMTGPGNGSGIFLATIPEPSAMLLCGLAGLLLARSTGRRRKANSWDGFHCHAPPLLAAPRLAVACVSGATRRAPSR